MLRMHSRLSITFLLFAIASFAQLTGSGTVAITNSNPVTQSFDTLAVTGTSNSTLPTGWYFLETGTNANATYAADTGSSNGGNTYSYGATGNTDRAFGALASGSLLSRIGAQIVNNSTGVITSLTISYVGEQWRRGSGTGAATDDSLTFTYSTSASGLADLQTWTAVPSLNFTSPRCGSTNTATDGNSSACRTAITATITGLSIPPGATIWLRWSDSDSPGADDGLSIDEVSITPAISFVSTNPTASAKASPSPVGPDSTTTLAGTIQPGFNPSSSSYTVSCNLTAIGGSATQTLPVTGTTFSYLATVSASTSPANYTLPCSVTDDQARSTNFNIGLLVLVPLNSTCGAAATPITSIQGTGFTSPLVNQIVEVEAVVTGSYQGTGQLGGFFLQQAATSQASGGLFVFASTPTVTPGNLVRVRGTVVEFSSVTSGQTASQLTELTSVASITTCGTASIPAPVQITLPVSSTSDWERYEGMLVQITTPLVVTGNFSLGRFGQLELAPQVLYQPTQTPGNATTWAAATDLNNRSRIILDDASTSSDANINGGTVAPYPAPGLSDANTLRVGATVNPGGTGLTGFVDDRFSAYRIQPSTAVSFSNTPNPRPDTTALSTALGGRIRVVSANVLNYFTTLNSRGAATATELNNQRTKLVEKLRKLNADIYGISEMQNFANGGTNGGTYTNAALADLTTALATATGRAYTFIDTINGANIVGGNITINGTDAIRNAIIYDPVKVTPVGLAALYNNGDQNRPSLAQTFRPTSGLQTASQTFTVVVNHFRSKGSGCGAGDDVYQGGCNSMRIAMSSAVRSWLSTNPTGDPAGTNRRYLLIGDFNAYYGETPMQDFEGAGGYIDLINAILGPTAYSYNFGAQAGYLDHVFANPAMNVLVKSVLELHVNADEPTALQALDSNLKSATAQTAYFGVNEFAASDHDPILIALNPLRGDLNDDGVIDLLDRNIIVAAYGKPASQVDRRLDFDGDGVISPNDYRIWFNFYRSFTQVP
jgi:predicted extracellular nuclease